MVFQKIVHEKRADSIVRQIQTLILDGVLRPGDRLPPERELAKILDVSRPTLHEAIEQLENNQLLVSKQGGGTFVARVLGTGFDGPLVHLLRSSGQTAVDYIEFRQEVEGRAAYLAALRATEPDRQLIHHNFERMLAAHERADPREEADVDAEFHISVVEAAHNIIMLHIMYGLLNLLREGVFYNRNMLYRRKGAREIFLEQHRQIHDSVMEGDPDGARDSVVQHMSYLRDALQEIHKQEVWQQAAENRLAKALGS